MIVQCRIVNLPYIFNKILLSLILFLPFRGYTQVTLSKTDTGNVYKIYSKQVESLVATRGMPEDQIKEMIIIFDHQNIASDERFAEMLGRHYPKNQGIGILFHFLTATACEDYSLNPVK